MTYVGNPLDTVGKPDLKIAVISRPERPEQFPDAPTFNELGVEGLDNEIMWRGVAVKNGRNKQSEFGNQERPSFERQACRVILDKTPKAIKAFNDITSTKIRLFYTTCRTDITIDD